MAVEVVYTRYRGKRGNAEIGETILHIRLHLNSSLDPAGPAFHDFLFLDMSF